ncbi:MAG: hypothetical protein GY877_13475 [Hyphomicrobium sp.]|nr:hypothetical protein [Hyphomicrobium sp.]
MMRLALVALACTGTAACADDRVTPEEAKSIQAALNSLDCYGGDMERKSGGAAAYEVDDAVCKDGQYEFKLDKDFKITSKKRD